MLRVTPEELMTQANQIASKAEELNNKVKQLDDTISNISSAWTGISSNKFYNQYVEMQPALHGFAQILQAIAAEAQGAAKAYDEVDSSLMG